MKALYALVIVIAISACASIQPAAVQAGDRCVRCRRPIGDVKLAAEIIDQLKTPYPLRTAGCLAKYIKAHPGEQLAGVFVTDYHTGHMLPADAAWYVATTLTQPNGRTVDRDYLAFRSQADAESFRTEGRPTLRWAQVVAEAAVD